MRGKGRRRPPRRSVPGPGLRELGRGGRGSVAARPGGGERGRHGAEGRGGGSALPPLRPSRQRPRSPRPARPPRPHVPSQSLGVGAQRGEGRAVLSEAEEGVLGRLYVFFSFDFYYPSPPPRFQKRCLRAELSSPRGPEVPPSRPPLRAREGGPLPPLL